MAMSLYLVLILIAIILVIARWLLSILPEGVRNIIMDFLRESFK